MDLIYAPSNSTREELISKGIDAGKILVYLRGIDIGRFSPSNRNGFYKKWSVGNETFKLLYVGRVSKEKNLHLLLDAFRNLTQKTRNIVLTIVGDGPYLEEMKAQAADLPCIFTGALDGDLLAAAYASSDLFVFPSTTDTFGNVELEAQVSGLPVIVTDQDGPCENILDGKTGIIIEADSTTALLSAMEIMVSRPAKTAEMGKAARHAMENCSFEAAFSQTWGTFNRVNTDKLAVAV